MRPLAVLFTLSVSAALSASQDTAGDLGMFLDVFQAACVVPTQEDSVCFASPAPCDAIEEARSISLLLPAQYFFNSSSGTCQQYPASLICPPVSANYFDTLQECGVACLKQCQQAAPSQDGACSPLSVGFYYDGQTCVQTNWDGCRTTANIFETAEECSTTCNPYEVTIRASRQASASAIEETTRFCQDFKRAVSTPSGDAMLPDFGGIPNLVNQPLSPTVISVSSPEAVEPTEATVGDLPTAAAPEASTTLPVPTVTPTNLCQRLKCIRSTVTSRSRLNWVSVYARNDCIEVVVRLNCRKGLFRRPNDTELDRLCGLTKKGVEKYWSRSVSHSCDGNSVSIPVRVKVQLVNRFLALNAKDVVVKVYNGEPSVGNTRSHNSDIASMTMKYDYADHAVNPSWTNDVFEETAAHELGHSVLRAARGFSYSWTHKGTSTWYGKLLNQNRQPHTGEIDLMKYYKGARRSDWRTRTAATEEDVLYLVDEGKFAYCSDGDCGSHVGHPIGRPCIKDSDCDSGRCQFFRCVECKKDSHCPDGKHCANQVQFWKANRCEAGLEHGKVCTRDRQCAGHRCHGFRCGECERDTHCPSGQYCSGRNLPIVQANRCKPSKQPGALCTRDAECADERCHGLRCGECETDSHCSKGEHCSGRNLPLVLANRCKAGKRHGALCTRNAECQNGRCHGLRCGECETDSHCSEGEYCSGRNLPVVQANRCKAGKRHGALCTRNAECQNGRCHGLRCGECETDSHCPNGTQYCSGRNLPLLLANRCKAGKRHGALCTRNAECQNGRCHGLRCGECETDSHCSNGEYCSGRNLPAIQANRCKSRLTHGSACTRDAQCSTGRCHGLRCGDCETDSHCPRGQYCSGKNLPLLSANRCKPGKGRGAGCLRGRECASTFCSLARCGDCKSDGHCPSTHYCGGTPPFTPHQCKRKRCSGGCTSNRQCGKKCSWFRCKC